MAHDARYPDARFCPACGTALAPTEPGGTAGGADDDLDPGGSGFIGREVAGRYRIQAKLGEGGMGAVYRAEQISLKRTVALKVLRPELSAEAGMVRRFNAEAELAAKLSHPNTVTLFDFGQDADGCLFIAMEYLEGRSLRDVLSREGPLPAGRALAICEQVCASLSDAHHHGIVHRDLKPDNVILAQRGRQTDVVRVLDFGIAKLRDEQGDVTNRPMTRAGDLLGTPQYMAPEQIRGETVDARTDVYALGAMLYEMVTGRLPFEGPTLMSILSKHLTEMPVPPRERRPDLRIAPALSQLVMDALNKEPAQRPPTMDAFADRLARLVVEVGPRTGPSFSSSLSGEGYPPPPALPESPPPGVPLLRTPVPGSIRSPLPAPVPVPPPVRAESPAPGSHPPPAYTPPAYTPPAYTPPPSHPAYAPPSSHPAYAPPSPHPAYAPPSPSPGYPSPAPYTPSPTYPPFATAEPSRAGRRGLWIAVGGLAAAGAGVAVFFAARGGADQPIAAALPGVTTPALSGAPAPGARSTVVPDFTVQPERTLYGDDPAPAPPSAPGSDPLIPGYAQPGVGVWEGGWWKDASGAVELDIPKGFSVGAGGFGGAAMFAGNCGGAPCTIQTLSSSTYGMQVDDAMIAQVVSQMPVAMGQSGSVSRVETNGRDRYSVIVDNAAEGMRGQLVVFHNAGVLAIVVIQAPQAGFDATAEFRAAFFEKRVRVRTR